MGTFVDVIINQGAAPKRCTYIARERICISWLNTQNVEFFIIKKTYAQQQMIQ
jgi:hypothetical protein